MIRRLLLIAAIVGALCAGVAAPAQALPFPVPGVEDCSPEGLMPQVPGDGWTAGVLAQPKTLPAPGDPWAENPTTTIYEQYGVAGFNFTTYDHGCGGGVEDAFFVAVTLLVNLVCLLPVYLLIGLIALLSWVAGNIDQWRGSIDPAMEQVVGALRDGMFTPLGLIVVSLTAAWIILLAWRNSWGRSVTVFAMVLFGALLATLVFQGPTRLAHTADDFQMWATSGVTNALNGTQPGYQTADVAIPSAMVDAVLWERWVVGNFGSLDSPTARKYAVPLFKAGALTWTEAAAYRRDPGSDYAKQILESHRADYQEIAEQIKDEDPIAYSHLTGDMAQTRALQGGMDVLLAACTGLFLAVAMLMVTAFYLIVRLAIMFSPVLFVLGMFPTTQHLLMLPLRIVRNAAVNSLIFNVAALISVAVLMGVARPNSALPELLPFALVGLLSYLMWKALRPMARMVSTVKGYDPVKSAQAGWEQTKSNTKAVAAHGLDLGKAAAGAYVGGMSAGAAMAGRGDGRVDPPRPGPETATPTRRPRPPVPRTPMPAPAPATALDRAPDPVTTNGRNARRATSTVDRDGRKVWGIYNPVTGEDEWMPLDEEVTS